ncbi:hypothetical protein C0995_012064 [Termitomyces sp. Mi166|nr:hypothetical protein C0995_012064 [Termitomyces sp. Mi166\
MRNSGLADVLAPGEGAIVVLVSAGKGRVRIHSVHVKVDSIKFIIRDSKHDLLYKTPRPLATGLVKRKMLKVMEGAITTGLKYIDGHLVNRMEMGKAEEDERGSGGDRRC